MRSRSPEVGKQSSVSKVEGETSNVSRRERRHINDGRGRSPIRRNASASGREFGQAPGFRGGYSGSMEPGELSENIKTESTPTDSSLEVLYQLAAGVTQPALSSTGQA